MRNWKIAWLASMLIVLSAGIIWIFVGNGRQVSVSQVVSPTPTIVESGLKIAVMADIHNDTEELEKMLVKAKNNGNELVVLAGDITNEGKAADLVKIKNVLDEVDLKYAVIPGNHEYDLDLFKKYLGKNYQSIRIGEVKLILIDNSYWQGLDDEQKVWIQREVTECPVLICVAIMHKPLNNPLSAHIMGENNKKAAAEAIWLRDLLVRSGVKQIEAGHLHYASSYELEGIRTDIVGAVSRTRNTQTPRFTELVIGKNSIGRNVVVEEEYDFGN